MKVVAIDFGMIIEAGRGLDLVNVVLDCGVVAVVDFRIVVVTTVLDVALTSGFAGGALLESFDVLSPPLVI